MNPTQDRLFAIAQRLDELAGDGPSELTTLSEELGQVAENWPEQQTQAPTYRGKDMPRYMIELMDVIERAAGEIVAERYGMTAGNSSRAITISLPNPNYYVAPATFAAGVNTGTFKGISGV